MPSSIDKPSFLYNPAVLPLPEGSLYRYLAVNRSTYDAEKHRIIHSSFHKKFSSNVWGVMLICLINKDFVFISQVNYTCTIP